MRRLGAVVLSVGLATAGLASAGVLGAVPAAGAVVPTLSVGDVTVWEGDSGTLQMIVPVDLSTPTTVAVTTRFTVTSSDADSGDFLARTGTLKIAAGVATGRINVTVRSDTVDEADETVDVTLTSPLNATIADGVGTVTIRDDDDPQDPNHLDATIGDVTVQEADAGTHYVLVPVTLSAPAPQTIKVAVSSTGSCSYAATAGSDFIGSVSRTITFLAGQRSKRVKFTIIGDATPEYFETLVESVKVTVGPAVARVDTGGVEITDDLGPPPPVDAPPPPPPPPVDSEIRRVSVASDGTEAISPTEIRNCILISFGSDALDISADGRTVLFWSAATNLVPNDTNGKPDLFVHDSATGATERVSVGSGGAQMQAGNGSGAMTNDGRYVLFPNGNDLYLRDRATDTTQLIAGNGAYLGTLSDDARYIAYRSGGTTPSLVVLDRVAGTSSTIASLDSWSASPEITPDGRYVAFVSPDTNLVPGDTNHFPDVFVLDRTTSAVERVNVATDGTQETSSSDINTTHPHLSADGQIVTFASWFSSLAPYAIVVRDRTDHTTTLLPDAVTSPAGAPCIQSQAGLSSDARYIALEALCTNADGSYIASGRGVYRYDRLLGTTVRIDVLPDGTLPNGDPVWGFKNVMSSDGAWFAFGSYSSNLVANDDNDQRDVFLAPAG